MNKVDYLLVCLAEEAADIQKAACKAIRFGLDNHHPDRKTTNKDDLIKEVMDLQALCLMLSVVGVLPKEMCPQGPYIDKVLNVIKYEGVSRQCGKLEEEQHDTNTM
jgi:hypothetical protein